MVLTDITGYFSDIYYIYYIECKSNKKKYVGRTRKPRNRQINHFNALRGNRHCNAELQKDFNLYGEDDFSFVIVDTAENNVFARKQKERFWMEKFKTYNPNYGYNGRDAMFRRCTPI